VAHLSCPSHGLPTLGAPDRHSRTSNPGRRLRRTGSRLRPAVRRRLARCAISKASSLFSMPPSRSCGFLVVFLMSPSRSCAF
jgi:hypothetical protein